jgi:hypothetical protein
MMNGFIAFTQLIKKRVFSQGGSRLLGLIVTDMLWIF